jgi:hypothetical protein
MFDESFQTPPPGRAFALPAAQTVGGGDVLLPKLEPEPPDPTPRWLDGDRAQIHHTTARHQRKLLVLIAEQEQHYFQIQRAVVPQNPEVDCRWLPNCWIQRLSPGASSKAHHLIISKPSSRRGHSLGSQSRLKKSLVRIQQILRSRYVDNVKIWLFWCAAVGMSVWIYALNTKKRRK